MNNKIGMAFLCAGFLCAGSLLAQDGIEKATVNPRLEDARFAKPV